jgi:hypothetical protein
MSAPTRTPQEPSTARRRLLRGAFAVPAVMTVHSGSALANSSNDPLRCLTNTDPVPGVTDSAFSPDDSFKRVELGRLDIVGRNPQYYVDGNNVVAVAAALGVGLVTSFIDADQYRRFNIRDNTVTGNLRKKCPVPPKSTESGTPLSSSDEDDGSDEEKTVGQFTVTRQPDPSLAAGCSSAYHPEGGKFAVLMFDAGGNIVGVGGPTGLALIGSCWASLAP